MVIYIGNDKDKILPIPVSDMKLPTQHVDSACPHLSVPNILHSRDARESSQQKQEGPLTPPRLLRANRESCEGQM